MAHIMKWKNGLRPKVLAIASDKFGCGMYRIMNPSSMLNRMKLAEVAVILQQYHPIDVFDDPRLSQIDVLLGQRIYNKQWLAGILTQRDKYGFSFVYEIDDSLDTIDPSNPAFKFFRYKNKQEVLSIYHSALECSDAVFTTTDYLADECKKWAKRAYVLPNGIDPSEIIFNNVPKNSISDKVRICYWGGTSHFADFSIVLNALERIMSKHSNVELFFWGFMPESGLQELTKYHGVVRNDFEYFKSFYDTFKDRIIYYPFVDTELFQPLLSTFQVDISIAPLKASKFDNAKSELKVVESGFLGVPIVASDVFPYRKIIKNGVNGFIAKKSFDWYKYLDLLINDKQKRIQIGNNLNSSVIDNYDLHKIAYRYIKAFEDIKVIKDKTKDKTKCYQFNNWWEIFGIGDQMPNKSRFVMHDADHKK